MLLRVDCSFLIHAHDVTGTRSYSLSMFIMLDDQTCQLRLIIQSAHSFDPTSGRRHIRPCATTSCSAHSAPPVPLTAEDAVEYAD